MDETAEVDDAEPEDERKGFRWVAFGAAGTAIWAVALGWHLWFNHPGGLIEAPEPLPVKLNELGDFLAGAFAPLAFLWLIIAVMVQAQELSLQRLELRLTRREFEKTRKVAKMQVEEAHRAAESAAEANRITRLEQRPWLTLKIPPAIVGGLRFSEGQVAIGLNIEISNFGKSPARDVRIEIKIATFPTGFRTLTDIFEDAAARRQTTNLLTMGRMQRRMRRKARRGRDTGPMIFPNEVATFSRVVTMSEDDASKAKASDHHHTEWVVLICVDYLLAGEPNEASKQTAVTYGLQEAIRPGGEEIEGYSSEISFGRDILAHELRLIPYRFSAYSAD